MLVYPEVEVTNRRSEVIKQPAKEPVPIRVTTFLDSAAVAELPGQIDIEILKCISRDAPLGTWSRVEYRGRDWDIAAPPRVSAGGASRATRHIVFSIRSRPHGAGANG